MKTTTKRNTPAYADTLQKEVVYRIKELKRTTQQQPLRSQWRGVSLNAFAPSPNFQRPSQVRHAIDQAKYTVEELISEEREELEEEIAIAEQILREIEKERESEDVRQAVLDEEEHQQAMYEHNLKKTTGYGHGHLSSQDKEKRFFVDYDECLDDLYEKRQKHGWKLEMYPAKITTSYTKWNKQTRQREEWGRSTVGYFQRTFRELEK